MKIGKPLAASGALVVLSTLVATGQQLFDGLLSDWLADCSIVLETRFIPRDNPLKDRALVTLYTLGDMPPTLDLAFKTDVPVMTEVALQANLERSNRATHPQNKMRCPEDAVMCRSDPPYDSNATTGLYNEFRFQVTDLDPNYHFDFYVEFDKSRAVSDFGAEEVKLLGFHESKLPEEPVYFQALVSFPTMSENICSVEAANFSNIFIRMSLASQLLSLAVVIVGLAMLVAYLRSSENEAT